MNEAGVRPLIERKIYIPRMNYGSASLFAAAFRALGIEAEVLQSTTPETMRLSNAYTSGDECLPQRITLGNMLDIINKPGFDPSRSAFYMPTTHGPCRFGQYSLLFQRVFKKVGCEEILILSPSTKDGYSVFGNEEIEFTRTAWRALVIGDILRNLLLKTRPYERNQGETDEVHSKALERMMNVIGKVGLSHKSRMNKLVAELKNVREDFRKIPVSDMGTKPLVGVIGEIYCRLDEDANDNIIRVIESYGGEVWLSGVCEWLEYTNDEVLQNLRANKRSVSLERVGYEIRKFIQRRDEHALKKLFVRDFKGYEEPKSIEEIFEHSHPYLPSSGAVGEMVISIGRSVYLYKKGVDGIVDISPFTCMNAIVSEAIYPKVSRDHDNLPIKTFYFDGKVKDWSQDVEMFMELVCDYRTRRKETEDRRQEVDK